MAGVYAAVDRTRGVWKAPANVSLADVSGVAVKVNDRMQEDLNVTSTGKSVNAIRAFTGKGSLVWGARTLAGNDNEWRYVPVRRFFNMAEESIKKATEPFVFEPNDRGTWVRVRAMIENFLTVQWRQGALAGAVTAAGVLRQGGPRRDHDRPGHSRGPHDRGGRHGGGAAGGVHHPEIRPQDADLVRFRRLLRPRR